MNAELDEAYIKSEVGRIVREVLATELEPLLHAAISGVLRSGNPAINSPPALSSVLPGMLSKEELSKALGVTPRSIDRYVVAGMPCSKMGGKRVFSPTVVAAWLSSQAPATTQEAAKRRGVPS